MPRKKFIPPKLEFLPTGRTELESKASVTFSNGYGANIIYRSPNTNRERPYEFELTFNGVRTINHNISDDNIGYCSEEEITQLLKETSQL